MYPIRKYVILSGLLTSLLFLFTAQAQPPVKGPPAPGTSKGVAIQDLTPVGISGCSGCHGKPIPSGTPALAVPETKAWESAYTHWLSYDNHAKAYSVLREERAKNMMERLSGKGLANLNPEGQETLDYDDVVGRVMTIPVRVKDQDGTFGERRARLRSKDNEGKPIEPAPSFAQSEHWEVILRKGDAADRKFTILGPARYHPDATQESRCLACHTNPSLAFTPTNELARKYTESHRLQGVGCEACHGNASSWRDSHVNWPDGPGKKKLYDGAKMVWLNDPLSRARACAGCHVGAPPDERSPEVRNMNHDMIAAGHPRLNFEYSNYQSIETPHWIEKDRTKSGENEKRIVSDAPFHGRNWLIGRAVQMEQSLALLAYRTSPDAPETTEFAGLDKEAETTRTNKTLHRIDPWPELAEFNCYACHQSLRAEFYPPSGTEEKKGPDDEPGKEPTRKFPISKKKEADGPKETEPSDITKATVPPQRPVGSWVWDPLYGTARIFDTQRLENDATESLKALQEAIHARKPKREEIHKRAKAALTSWQAVSTSLLLPSAVKLDERRTLLGRLPRPLRWDELAQTYLGFRSLNGNRGVPEIEEKLYFPYSSETFRQDSPQSYDKHEPGQTIPPSYDPKKAREQFLKDLPKLMSPGKE